MLRISTLILLFGLGRAAADDGLLHHWRFDPAQAKEHTIAPLTGKLPATVIGPIQFSKEEPRSLVLDGNAKARHRVRITETIAEAGLPAKEISVEAWVRVDRVQQWGGIAGAMQDNGAYEKGWLLGIQSDRFFFAVASKGAKNLTYLTARTSFQSGYWYHVLGTYDGKVQNLYVDGRLQASSKEQSGDIDYPPKAFYTLGAYHDDDEFYPMQGRLESVAVFTKALTAEKVAGRFKERKKQFPDIDEVRLRVTDWPTVQRDNLRTGISEDKLPFPLKLAWSYRARHAPRPAWSDEARADYFHNKYKIEERVTFDRAFHIVGVGDRIYLGSSADGTINCHDADTGQVRWTFFTEGPVRLAPTVAGDRVLAGSDDGHVYCLNARDGALLWKHRVGPSSRRIPGNERIISAWPVRTDVLVEDGRCHVCAGVFPSQGVFQATLDLKDGKLLESKKLGVTAQGYLERRAGQLMVSTGRDPAGAFVNRLKRLGKEVGKEARSIPSDYPYAFIGAGDVRIGGGDGKLAAFRLSDGSKLWSANVEGRVFSLAVVRGRLLASTDRGYTYCFTPVVSEARTVTPPSPVEPPYPDTVTRDRYRAAADAIVKQADQARGYCLVLGSTDGWLTVELARQTGWQIVGRETDSKKVERSRRLVDAAGLGERITIHHGPLDALPYADLIFNVVVSDSLAGTGSFTGSKETARRLVRPGGGLAFFGLGAEDVYRRKPLEGVGEWTHMYADPANTACSGDQLVRGAMDLLWFGPPGPRAMIDRHHRTSAPVYRDGRLFVPGEDRVFAVDAYNGTVLWDQTILDSRRVAAFRDSSHLVVAAEALYVAASGKCLALEPQTGKPLRTYSIPDAAGPQKYEWGHLMRAGDFLIGSGVKQGSIRRNQSHTLTVTETHWDFVPIVGSDFLFAYRPGQDKPAWTYRAENGLIINPSLTVGNGRVYFLESTNLNTLKEPIARVRLAEMLGKGSKLTALDLRTGKVLWSVSGELFMNIRHNVFISYAGEKLAIVGSYNSGTDKKTATLLYDAHGFDAATGAKKWSKTQDQKQKINGDHGEQERRPVIVGNRLFCEPMAYDLASGEKLDWQWPWTNKARRGCGTLSASASCFFFRDDNVKLFDLKDNRPSGLTSETRPGCWINLLPVGGLLLAPEASSGCTCNFSVQTSLALVPITPGK